MIVAVVIGGVVLVALVLMWLRSAASRVERRSIRRYGEVLGVLGDVARRGDLPGSRPPGEEGVAQIHLAPHDADTEVAPPHRDAPVAPPIRLGPTTAAAKAADGLPVFGDPDLIERMHLERPREVVALARLVARVRSARPSAPPVPAPFDPEGVGTQEEPATLVAERAPTETPTVPVERPPSRRPPASLAAAPSRRGPRLQLLAAALVICAAIAGGSYAIVHAERRGGTHAASGTGTTLPRHKSAASSPTTTTTLPVSLTPVSATASLVTYQIPTSSYTLHFSATSPCWLGIERAANGSYLWMDTLDAGGATSYSATGTIVVRIGAPNVLTVTVNGITVQLPANRVQPYDIALRPPS